MTREDSIQIELVRIICITSMMWVHVAPGLNESSYVSGGPGELVGLFLGQSMGRISVTTLSFVSGYLFWRSGSEKDLADVCRRLFFSILMPMLVWSACFIALAKAKAVFLGEPTSALSQIEPGFLGMLNAWTGFGGVTANESLFFIRDLIVSTLIVLILAPLVRRLPWVLFAAAIGILFLPHLGFIVFRPSILSFVLTGAIAARSDLTVAWISRPVFSLPLGFTMIALTPLLAETAGSSHWLAAIAQDICRRAGIGLMILALTRSLVGNPRAVAVARHGRHAFLAYLSHMIVIGISWTVWQELVAEEQDVTYLLYFILTPPACFMLASTAGRLLDRAPPLVQIVLRGRVFAVGSSRIADA